MGVITITEQVRTLPVSLSNGPVVVGDAFAMEVIDYNNGKIITVQIS